MAKYIVLFTFTDQGIRNIKQSPERVDAAKETFKKFGAEVREFFLLMGRYDTAFIVEAADDESVAKACIAEASKGNVHTETLRGFSEDEFRMLVNSLP